MAGCNLSTLIDQACENGFRCLDEKTFRGVLLQLLCDFQASGGGGGGGPLVYRALLTQSGTGDPTSNVLENTLGGAVIFTRDEAGIYTLTLSGAFPVGSTLAFVSGVNPMRFVTINSLASPDSMQIIVTDIDGNGVDGNFTNSPISILVYPP